MDVNVKNIIARERLSHLYETEARIGEITWKKKIKKYSQIFRKQQRQAYLGTQNKLNYISRSAAQCLNYDTTRIMELQEMLTDIEQETCTGAILRSKALNAIEGGKNTKYFLNLENKRQDKKQLKN